MFAKIAPFALFLAVTQAMHFKVKKPDVEMCMAGTDAWVSGIALDVTPWPVNLGTGSQITLNGAITLLQAIEVGAMVKLKLTVQTDFGDLPFPCLPVSLPRTGRGAKPQFISTVLKTERGSKSQAA